MSKRATDRNGTVVNVGSLVKLLELRGDWLTQLPAEEQERVLSMVGEVFEVEEVDEAGYPWIHKSFPGPEENMCYGHSIAPESYEIEVVELSRSN